MSYACAVLFFLLKTDITEYVFVTSINFDYNQKVILAVAYYLLYNQICQKVDTTVHCLMTTTTLEPKKSLIQQTIKTSFIWNFKQIKSKRISFVFKSM